MMFLNRTNELSVLDDILRRKGAQFVAVYGRRRIGKTALLAHWLGKSAKVAGILGECKWTERPIPCDVLDELQNKARSLKSIASFKKHFALFSKNGFTKDVVEKAKKENLLLFSVKDMGL